MLLKIAFILAFCLSSIIVIADGFFLREQPNTQLPIKSALAQIISYEMKQREEYRMKLFKQLVIESHRRKLELERKRQELKKVQIYKKYLGERRSTAQFLRDFHTLRY